MRGRKIFRDPVDPYLAPPWRDPPELSDEEWCERCDGEGVASDLADCTTFDKDCACNGPRVSVDPCPDCDGSGRLSGWTP